MSSYCAESDVMAVTSRWAAYTGAAAPRVDQAIINASLMVDIETEQWFDARAITVTTQPQSQAQKKLFMPAPVISLTSVTESGISIPLAQIVTYPTWIEKAWPGAGGTGFVSPYSPWVNPTSWRPGQMNIVVVGSFGFATTPQDIVAATAYIAALMIGMVETTTIGGDGAATSKLMKEVPAWVKRTLIARKKAGMVYQPFVLA